MRTVLSTEVFDIWFARLKDARARARINARIRRVEQGNLGDCSPVGEGVSELRILPWHLPGRSWRGSYDC
jgi:putative addiction module killer protein